MELVLVRHAEPEWVRDGLAIDDPPLTERGFEQAERLAARLADEHFDEVVVSPLLRTRQTAAPLLRRYGVPLRTEPWMPEIRSPVWQGTPAEKAEAAFKAERAKASHDRWDGLPGGESVRDFVERIRSGARGFLAEREVVAARDDLPVWHVARPGARVLFVGHAGTNAVLICHLLGLQPVPWEWERFVLGHASISRVEALEVGDGYTFSLTRLSDVEHLDAEQRTR
jgi:probable phosphoglycerate mutase